jgi:4-hydroxy-2-oxoheptanedioate aldolase
MGGPSPLFQFQTLPAAELMAAANEATMVVVMIESEIALHAAEEIASVECLYMLSIGANDLCNSLGIPGQHDHSRIREAYQHCIEICRKRCLALGIGGMGAKPALAKELVELGARYVSVGNDLGFLLAGASAQAKPRQIAG